MINTESLIEDQAREICKVSIEKREMLVKKIEAEKQIPSVREIQEIIKEPSDLRTHLEQLPTSESQYLFKNCKCKNCSKPT
jgi:hypothetical protein